MLLSFVCMAFVAFLTGQGFVLMAAAAVIGAIFGFLRFNTHPAVVFMGDTGSQLIGFLAICLSLQLTQGESPVSRLFPLLLLGFPVLDTLTVMTERIAEGRSPFKPDKKHFHHKLMNLGLYHTEAVFAIYLIQAVLVTSAFFLRFYSEWVILSVYAVF
jgi:UDP-GlcNAc:undecaprenyl-phosphate GlcNAc-1-phosphate transferase